MVRFSVPIIRGIFLWFDAWSWQLQMIRVVRQTDLSLYRGGLIEATSPDTLQHQDSTMVSRGLRRIAMVSFFKLAFVLLKAFAPCRRGFLQWVNLQKLITMSHCGVIQHHHVGLIEVPLKSLEHYGTVVLRGLREDPQLGSMFFFPSLVAMSESKKMCLPPILRKLMTVFVLSQKLVTYHGDSFPFDVKPNGFPFGSKSKGKLSPRLYSIQRERKWKYSFLSVSAR